MPTCRIVRSSVVFFLLAPETVEVRPVTSARRSEDPSLKKPTRPREKDLPAAKFQNSVPFSKTDETLAYSELGL